MLNTNIPSEDISRRHRGFGLSLVVAAYLLISGILWASFDGATRLKYSGDGQSWYAPSVGLFLHGKIVLPESPETPSIYRPPIYPAFGAMVFAIVDETDVDAIALVQILILLMVGLIFRSSVDDWLPGWGTVGMGVLLFNPNVLTIPQYIQSDTLFLFFMTVVFWGVLRYARGVTWWGNCLLIGGVLALGCLTRPTAQFLVLSLPLALLLIDLSAGRRSDWLRGLMKGIGAAVLAVAVLAPWADHVKQIEGRYDLSPAEVKARYIWDQIAMVEAQHSGISYHQASELEREKLALLVGREDGWRTMTERERFAKILEEGFVTLLAYPPIDLATAYGRSILQFLGAGGAGRWHYLVAENPDTLASAWFESSQSDILGMLQRMFGGASLPAALASFGSLLFVIGARLLGLVGLASIVRRREWELLLIVVGFISYFAIVHLFVGNSRYRLAVEPALMLLLLFGADAIWQRLKVHPR